MAKMNLFKGSKEILFYIFILSFFIFSCKQSNSFSKKELTIPAILDNNFGFINNEGETVIPFKFKYAGFFSKENLAPAIKDSLFGYINKRGEWVISPAFKFAFPFHNGLAKVIYPNGTSSFIIPNGIVAFNVDESKYNDIGFKCYDFGFIAQKKENRLYALLDKKGNEILSFSADECHFLDENHLALRCFGNDFDSLKIIDSKGNILFQSNFFHRVSFSDRTYQICCNSKNGEKCLLTDDFKISYCYPGHFNIFGDLHEGKQAFKKYAKTGYLDRFGNIVIDTLFDYGYDFSQNLAGVQLNGKYGFIDTYGDIRVPTVYDEILKDFTYGFSLVARNDTMIFIDHSGKEFWKMKYLEIYMQIFDLQ